MTDEEKRDAATNEASNGGGANAEATEGKTDDQPVDRKQLAREMANDALSHEDIQNSKPMKGVLSELKKERQRRRELEKQVKGDTGGDGEGESDDDDDLSDLFSDESDEAEDTGDGQEGGEDDDDNDNKPLTRRELLEVLKQREQESTQTTEAIGKIEESINQLHEAQESGDFDPDIDIDKSVHSVRQAMREKFPGAYRDIVRNSDNPARKLLEVAPNFVPEALGSAPSGSASPNTGGGTNNTSGNQPKDLAEEFAQEWNENR